MSTPPVRQERSRWRDYELSDRHRNYWGSDCPATDVDFLLVEYDNEVPIALVDYKYRESLQVSNIEQSSYRAIRKLASMAGICFFVVFYNHNGGTWSFIVTSGNERACQAVKDYPLRESTKLTEVEYVRFLYFLRNRELPNELLTSITQNVKANQVNSLRTREVA